MVTQEIEKDIKVEKTIIGEDRPKVIKTVSTLMLIISLLYVIKTFSMLGVVYVLNNALGKGNLAFSSLEQLPIFYILLVLFYLTSIFFFYLSFKIRNGSKFSWLLSLSSLLIVPAFISILGQFIFSPLGRFSDVISGGQSVYLEASLSKLFTFPNLVFLIIIITIIILVGSFKSFHYNDEPISKRYKIGIIIMSFVVVVPIISLVFLGYLNTINNDYGFKKSSLSVGYHIYKPRVVPDGLIYATEFTAGKELAGSQNAVQVSYDMPIQEIANEGQSKIIVLKQVKVANDFDLEKFVETFQEDSNISQVSLDNALNKNGFLVQKPLGNSTLTSLIYLTEDNILIVLMSPKVTAEDLVKFSAILE